MNRKSNSVLWFIGLFLLSPWFWNFILGQKSDYKVNSVFKLPLESIELINLRRSYYPDKLTGKIFENKLTVIWQRYKNRLFQGLDLNYFFFANHPRERPGMEEKEVFLWFWFPLFLIGFLEYLKKGNLVPKYIFLFILSVGCLLAIVDNFIFLLAPLLTIDIYYGLMVLRKK